MRELPPRRKERLCNRPDSIRKSDPVIDATLERILGDIDTLSMLIEQSTREGERRAASPPQETTRRIAELQNQKARVKDAYQVGAFELKDLRKRIAAIDGELSVLQDLLQREQRAIDIDPDLVTDLVEVFASWRDLRRRERRELLRSYQIRIGVTKTKVGRNGQIRIERVEIGSLDDVCIYK